MTWDTEKGWKCMYYFGWETALLWKEGVPGALGSWCCLFWCHTQTGEGKKVDGWDGSSAACLQAAGRHSCWQGWGRRMKKQQGYPALWCAPRFWWLWARLPAKEPTVGLQCSGWSGSRTRTFFVIHDSNEKNMCPWNTIGKEYKMGTEMPRHMTFQGASKQRKAIPIPAKIPKIPLAWRHIQKSPCFLVLSLCDHTSISSSQCFCRSHSHSCAAKTAFLTTAVKSIGKDRSDRFTGTPAAEPSC